MIPNIFISSTISDLHYLRDALRDTVADLSYNPVMSDYGEVGYLHPHTAAASCYRSIKQCQMVVLIIGRKYGKISSDGLSVTHQEFLTAQENGVPTITFVEGQVLNFKEVYEADVSAQLWDSFAGMDNPRKTFNFIDQVTSSASYNGLIPFTSVADAKRILKLQIADFVGERLNETIKPVRGEVQEVLAEIKTLRNQLSQQGSASGASNESKKYLLAMRFLLEDKHAEYRKFVESMAGDLDVAMPSLIKCENFLGFLDTFGYKVAILDNKEEFDALMGERNEDNQHKMLTAVMNWNGWYAVFSDHRFIVSSSMLERFSRSHISLQARLKINE